MSTAPDESMAPAADPEGVEVRPVQEVSPIQMWDKPTLTDNDMDLYDFRPRPEEDDGEVKEEEGPDPKASSAAGSALAAIYETVKTPDYALPPSPENPASAEKDSGEPSPSESGTPTSSTTETTSVGKTKPLA